MDIPLPPQFANRMNMLDAALIDYQSAHQSDKKDEARARIFVISCEILNSVNVDDLSSKLDEIYSRSNLQAITEGHDNYFDEFIDLEMSIFEKIGVDAGARSRIAEYMARARGSLYPPSMPPGLLGIAEGINELKSEVCRLSRITLAKIRVYEEESEMRIAKTTWREKVVNIGTSVFGVGVTAVNVGAGFAGFMSADHAAYSATVGATLLVYRK
jgi:hypothetical protein